MDTLKMIEGMNDAIKLLEKCSKQNSSGSMAIWRLTKHAADHIDNQINALLKAQ